MVASSAADAAREVQGELVDEAPTYAADLVRARRLARLMDSAVAIPGTNITIGLDALLGLVPGIGDALGTLLSAQIVIAAARSGVRTRVLMRMLLNLVLDTLVGAIPLLGDLFDVGFRANLRNLELLERHLGRAAQGRSARRRLVVAAAAIIGIAFLLAALGTWLAFAGIDALIGALR